MKNERNGSLDNFNFSIDVNSLVEKDKAPKAVRDQIPDGALYFKGVASNGDLNRNGYIIRSKAWKANGGEFLNDFLDNGKLLFQHDSDRPIGVPISAKVIKDELILTGYVFDDTHSSGDIGRGLVTSLSTGHITHAVEFENTDTGEIMSEDDFWKHEDHWDMYFSNVWKMAVTSAELVETSFVTIPSNRKSHIINKNYLINKSGLSEDEINNLYLNNSNMKLSKEELAAAEAAKAKLIAQNGADGEGEGEGSGEDGGEGTEENSVVINGVTLEKENALEVLEFITKNDGEGEGEGDESVVDENKLKEIVESSVNAAVKVVQDKMQKEINALRKESKGNLAKIVKNQEGGDGEGDDGEDIDVKKEEENLKDAMGTEKF